MTEPEFYQKTSQLFLGIQDSEIKNLRFFLYTWMEFFEMSEINTAIEKFELIHKDYKENKNRIAELFEEFTKVETSELSLVTGKILNQIDVTNRLYSKMSDLVTNEFKKVFKKNKS